jgi:hypothetical protein
METKAQQKEDRWETASAALLPRAAWDWPLSSTDARRLQAFTDNTNLASLQRKLREERKRYGDLNRKKMRETLALSRAATHHKEHEARFKNQAELANKLLGEAKAARIRAMVGGAADKMRMRAQQKKLVDEINRKQEEEAKAGKEGKRQGAQQLEEEKVHAQAQLEAQAQLHATAAGELVAARAALATADALAQANTAAMRTKHVGETTALKWRIKTLRAASGRQKETTEKLIEQNQRVTQVGECEMLYSAGTVSRHARDSYTER